MRTALTDKQRSAWGHDYYMQHHASNDDDASPTLTWSPQTILGHQPTNPFHDPNVTMRPLELDQLLTHFENLSSDHHNLQHISEICSPPKPTI